MFYRLNVFAAVNHILAIQVEKWYLTEISLHFPNDGSNTKHVFILFTVYIFHYEVNSNILLPILYFFVLSCKKIKYISGYILFFIYIIIFYCCCYLVTKSYLILCYPMDCSPPGSPVHGISQAKILECVAPPSSRGSFQPWDRTWISCVFCTADRFFTAEPLVKSISIYLYSI